MKIQIKHRWTADVLFEYERKNNSMKLTLEVAVSRGKNLSYANLYNANLSNADLSYADLYNADLSKANLSNADLSKAKGNIKLWRNELSIIKQQDCLLKAYKYLNGNKSPYQSFKYEIGKEYTFDDLDTDETVMCGRGGNVATLEWCLRDTNCDLDKTYIEVEFHSKDAVIPFSSDGKFRVRKFKILRKLTKKELQAFLK